MAKDDAHAMRDLGGEGGVVQVAIFFERVCAGNYSGARFTALSRGSIPGPSPVPGPAGDWGDKLRGSCGSTVRMIEMPHFHHHT